MVSGASTSNGRASARRERRPARRRCLRDPRDTAPRGSGDGSFAPDDAARAIRRAHHLEADTAPIDLPAGGALMRADRVDFPPRGIAYTHTHQGPGIRVLLRGRFRVETNGHTLELEPGEPWFERGPDPVYASRSPTRRRASCA